MTTFIALLRGINVGGHRVKMEHLRGLWDEMGFVKVRSFIQSGNIFFESQEEHRDALAATIEAHLLANLGYAVPVVLRTPHQLDEVLFPNAFENVEETPETRFLIAFSARPLVWEQPRPPCSPDGTIEVVQITAGEIFVVYRLTNGRPPDVGGFFKRTFGGKNGSAVTTRFYHTLLKMREELGK